MSWLYICDWVWGSLGMTLIANHKISGLFWDILASFFLQWMGIETHCLFFYSLQLRHTVCVSLGCVYFVNVCIAPLSVGSSCVLFRQMVVGCRLVVFLPQTWWAQPVARQSSCICVCVLWNQSYTPAYMFAPALSCISPHLYISLTLSRITYHSPLSFYSHFCSF